VTIAAGGGPVPEEVADPPAPALRVCLFGLDDGVFAVEARHARRVVVLEECTAVPGAPPHLVGVVNLGGSIVPVVDLRPVLALRPARVGPGTPLLVVAGPGCEAAVAIDRALGVASVTEAAATRPAPSAVSAGLAHGFVTWDGGDALVLDVPRLLDALRIRARPGRAREGVQAPERDSG
jgi:purine-binding chemotaxis protein CheW